jgi:general secretion pathway protein C
MKRLPFVAAAVLCAVACASGAYWSLQLFQPGPRAVVAAAKAPAPPAIEAAVGLFGGAPAAAGPVFQLKGVIEDGPDGVALLAADGQPAQAVGVGREVAPGVTVTEIRRRYVLLSAGGTVRRLELPDGPSAGVELVAAPPAAPARAPVKAAKSGGAMPPPAVNPALVVPPGQTPEQVQQMEQMRQVEQMRAHRPAGIGPAAFGAQPVS